MHIYRNIESLNLKNTVLTTGNFDGVHLGHQFLLRHLAKCAQEEGGRALVVMFYPHPREVLAKDDTDFFYLSTQEEKLTAFEKLGIDAVVEVPFSKALSQWGAEDFVKNILLKRLGMSLFLVGHDHKIGHPQKDQNLKTLSACHGFKIERCPIYIKDSEHVSSSLIRDKLALGKVSEAALLLGHPYAVQCTVIEGKKVGRSIGYPTANLLPVSTRKLVPADGVYAVRVKVKGKMYGGMLQIGYRPTLGDGRGMTIEVHIFDFKHEIYGEMLTVFFEALLRQNRKFSNISALRKQLGEDKISAVRHLDQTKIHIADTEIK